MINDTLYYIVCGLLVAGILSGIAFMSKVKTAVMGNRLSAVCIALAILLTLFRYNLITLNFSLIIGTMAAGTALGFWWAMRIKMIAMPQTVALLNGFGGAASALVGAITLIDGLGADLFNMLTAGLAVSVGIITLSGSLIAAGKLSGYMNQKPIILPGHQTITTMALVLSFTCTGLILFAGIPVYLIVITCSIAGSFFGIAFAIRIGGADMPITISLLNSLSGVAGSIAGMAIGDPLLVAVGGIVGASGLLLTRIMCSAMNRSLSDIITGRTVQQSSSVGSSPETVPTSGSFETGDSQSAQMEPKTDIGEILRSAKRIIIIPGYGMALAQAQMQVKELADKLEAAGVVVDFAIHPVAGRMPGHMNVLLAEVDVPYDKLREMDDINPEFSDCDIAIIIGANDVINPAAREAEDTPIYGMPILAADEARHIIICNLDLKPGYAGVENPLYKSSKASLLLGNAAETVKDLIAQFGE